MSDIVVRIDVSGFGGGEVHDLRNLLRTLPGLTVELLPPSEADHRTPPNSGTLALRADSAGAIMAGIRTLPEWLRTHVTGVTLRIKIRGETVELQSGTPVEEIGRLEPLVVAGGSWPQITAAPTGGSAYDNMRAPAALDLSEDSYQSPGGNFAVNRVADEIAGTTLPVTIYLTEEGIHDQVETAVAELLEAAGLRIEDRDDPVTGSWFRRMRAAAQNVTRSAVTHEGVVAAAHAADTRLVLAQDAAVTAALLQNLGPVIASLQPTKDAVLRVGALLIVKVDWAVNVFQLTAEQQLKLDHHPRLASSPHEILKALDLRPRDEDGDRLSLQ